MSPPVVQPLHDLSFPYGPSVQSAVFSPDGATVYANVHARTFDFGAVLDLGYFWGGVGVGATLLLVALLIVVRVLKRARRAGLLYCRKCNYCLEGLAAGQAQCPECGAELAKKKPVVGKRSVRRCAAAWLLVAVVVGLGVSADMHRRGKWTWAERGWVSIDLSLWLWKRKWDSAVPGWCWGRGEAIVAVDARTGTWRCLAQRSGMTFFTLEVTPDGKGLYVQPTVYDGIEVISVRDGSRIARWNYGSSVGFDVGGKAVIGHGSDGAVTWLSVAAGSRHEKSAAVRWNRDTGDWHEAVSVDGPGIGRQRQFLLVPGTSPQELLSYPSFSEAFQSKAFVVQWHVPVGIMVSEVDLGNDIAYHNQPLAFTPDGTMLLAGGLYTNIRLCGFDAAALRRGERVVVGEVKPPSRSPAPGLESLAFAKNAPSRLILSEFRGVLVRDVAAKQWASRLALPMDLFGVNPVISRDGGWAAATAQGGMSVQTSFSRLLIWRVPDAVGEGGSDSGTGQ